MLRFASRPMDYLDALTKEEPINIARSAWADSAFRDAVFLASPQLHRKVSDAIDRSDLSDDLARSVCRYAVRAAFRPTPFGAFAGVSLVSQDCPDQLSVPAVEEQKTLIEPNSEFVEWLSSQISSTPLRNQFHLSLNDTLYRSGEIFCFIEERRNKAGQKRYGLTEVDADDLLVLLIDYLKERRSAFDIRSFIRRHSPVDATTDEIEDYLNELITSQLVCLDGLHNITASEPLLHMAQLALDGSSLRKSIHEIHECFVQARLASECSSRVEAILAGMNMPPCPYPICKGTLFDARPTGGKLDQSIREGLEDILPLVLVEKSGRSKPLQQFVNNFETRFGDCSVPLHEVIKSLPFLGFASLRPKPILAIGGSKMPVDEHANANYQGIDNLLAGLNLNWGYIEHPLSSITSSPAAPSEVPLVAWMALWADAESRVYKELKSVGRQEPGRVMGRFARVLSGVQEVLAVREDLDAPSDGPINAEIVYKPSMKALNVVARSRLSSWEIRLRSGALNRDDGQLGISDLMVSVERGRVLLHDQLSGRQVIPRMSNAHAFTAKDCLPVYNFLNAVSNQDQPVRLETPRDRYPSAEVTPGILVGGTIIARPSWLPTTEFRTLLRSKSLTEAVSSLRGKLRDLGLPYWLNFCEGDNVIPLNLEIGWMAEEGVRLLRTNRRILITDTFPFDWKPALQSRHGRSFHELLLVARGKNSGNCTQLPKPTLDAFRASAIVPSRSEWRYYKIYCSTAVQDSVLTSISGPLASNDKSFFFVRYKDSLGEHLRFRIDMQRCTAKSIANFEDALEHLRDSGGIDTYSITPYTRETQRYGGVKSIKFAEEIFCIDSKIVIQSLLNLSETNKLEWLRVAANFDAYLYLTGLTSTQARYTFARRAAKNYAAEFHFGVDDNRKIGEVFRGSRAAMRTAWPRLISEAHERYSSIGALWQEAEANAIGDLYDIRWSLMHMHANRCFRNESRRQEAVLWELLKRAYMAELSMNS